MTRLGSKPWMPRNDPVTATLGGTLAVGAAFAAAVGSRLAPPIFGAVIAVALAAEAGLNALGEPALLSYRALGLAVARWLLAAGWLVFAVLLLHTPLGNPGPLRALITALIGAGAALRLLEWHSEQGSAPPPGLALGLFCSAAAIAVTWFGGSPTLAASPLVAIAMATTFELLGTGSSWLGSAWRAVSTKRTACLRPVRPVHHRAA